MIDLIIFSVRESLYAINLEKVKRIIQVPALTPIPNSHELVEGMISYESDILKVIGFRQILEYPSYASELETLFIELKKQHLSWIEALKNSVERDIAFQKTTNAHMCELGKWLDSFTSYDDEVTLILSELNKFHKRLHNSAVDILEWLEKGEKERAKEYLDTTVYETYNRTIAQIDLFIEKFLLVADSLQKILLYQGSGVTFAVKVDSIEDILHVKEQMIVSSDDNHRVNSFLEIEGIIEIDNRLINVIKEITLPS